jgi:transcriptional regulator with XRE-family HTH domain
MRVKRFTFHSNIGAKIRELRQKRGLSLSELAERAHISRSYLHQLESGESSPTEEKIRALATALGVLVSELMGEKDEAMIPQSLEEFATRDNIPSADVRMLAALNYRGKQPTTVEQWRTLYRIIRATLDTEG